MFSRLSSLFARLRTWFLVRIGLWRGQWRRGRVEVRAARLFPGPFANDTWSYGLYCPRGLRDDAAAPLVVLLHGCRQRALSFAQASGFTQAAQRERFRLLCPEQRRRANLWRCWNWFTPAAQRGAGELLVVREMLDEVARKVQVAEGQTAVVGLSAGGGLAALLAFHAADRVGAVVTVAAPPLLGRANTQDPRDVMRAGLQTDPTVVLTGNVVPAPLLIVHGGADAVVAPVCADQLLAQAARANARGGAALVATAIPGGDGRAISDYRSDDGQLRLRTVRLTALGHVWSGAAGAHAYLERSGERLTELALRFLKDVWSERVRPDDA